MNFETTEYTLPDHWAPAIINGDYSGLWENEISQMNEFLDDFDLLKGHWSVDSDDEPSFTCCHDAPFYTYTNCVTFYWNERVE